MPLEAFSPLQLALAAAVLVAAYVVRGIAGFGSALVAVPLLAMLLPLHVVVPMIVLLDNLGSLSHSLRGLHHVQWRELWLLPFTISGIGTALYLLRTLDPEVLRTALGGFIVAYAVYSLLPLPQLSGPRLWAVPLGFLAGLVGTLFGTGGPFTVIYLRLRQLGKEAFRGTVATIFLIDGGTRLLGFAASGYFQRETLPLIAAALPLMAVGLYLGGHIHVRLSQQAFVRIISVILLISGSSLLLRG